jgi:NTP pyrophosphatase (non-canonical NTP hydrolase)
MDIKELTERNYAATVRRELISDKTKFRDFSLKILEEYAEIVEARYSKKMGEEIADLIIVGFCMAKHYEIDIQKELDKKTLFNEKRP